MAEKHRTFRSVAPNKIHWDAGPKCRCRTNRFCWLCSIRPIRTSHDQCHLEVLEFGEDLKLKADLYVSRYALLFDYCVLFEERISRVLCGWFSSFLTP